MAGVFREVEWRPEFRKDFDRLHKRYRTLDEDLRNFVNTQLNLMHKIGLDNGGVVRIPDLGVEEPPVYKARRFSCKSLKGGGANTGIRVVYSYLKASDTIILIQIYYKQDRATEDRDRIKAFLRSLGTQP